MSIPNEWARDSFSICAHDSLQGVRLQLAWSIGIHMVGSSAWKTLAAMPTGSVAATLIVFRLGSMGSRAVSAVMMPRISWYAVLQVAVYANLTFVLVSCLRGCVTWARPGLN